MNRERKKKRERERGKKRINSSKSDGGRQWNIGSSNVGAGANKETGRLSRSPASPPC